MNKFSIFKNYKFNEPEIDIIELKAFFGLWIYFGIVNLNC